MAQLVVKVFTAFYSTTKQYVLYSKTFSASLLQL